MIKDMKTVHIPDHIHNTQFATEVEVNHQLHDCPQSKVRKESKDWPLKRVCHCRELRRGVKETRGCRQKRFLVTVCCDSRASHLINT